MSPVHLEDLYSLLIINIMLWHISNHSILKLFETSIYSRNETRILLHLNI